MKKYLIIKKEYYNLYLNDELTNECLGNCTLCYNDQTKLCIVCKNNYKYKLTELNEKYKICYEEN